jgi:hypothetical protein
MAEGAEGGQPGLDVEGGSGGHEELNGVADFGGEVVAIISNAYKYEGGEDDPPPCDVGGVLVVVNEAGEGDDDAKSATAGGGLGMGGAIVGDILEDVTEFIFDEFNSDEANDEGEQGIDEASHFCGGGGKSINGHAK